MMSDVANKIMRKWKKLRLQPIHVYCLHHICAQYDPDGMYRCDWMEIESFKKKIRAMMQAGIEFISLMDAYSKMAHDIFRFRRFAVLTIDDGYASLNEILPWLEEQNIPITLFINGKYLDGKSYRENPKERYLTKGELFAITNPLVSIANHGWEHKRVTDMPEEEFRASVEKNFKLLSTHPNYIPFWAYTYGSYTKESNAYLQALHLIPVYVNGEANLCDKGYIGRELLKVDEI